MSDIADNADKEIETNLQLAIALQLRSGTIVPPDGWDGRSCVECDEQVWPPKRLELGYVTCVSCQEGIERQKHVPRSWYA